MLDISIFHSFSWPLEWVLIMSNAPIEDCYRVAAPSWVGVWCERVPRAGTVRQHLCCFLKPNWKVAELLLSPSEEQNSIQLLLHIQQQLLRVVDWRQKLWWWWWWEFSGLKYPALYHTSTLANYQATTLCNILYLVNSRFIPPPYHYPQKKKRRRKKKKKCIKVLLFRLLFCLFCMKIGDLYTDDNRKERP